MLIKSFELYLAFRYLRSKKSEGFISLSTWFSFIGIALGVATLIIVMSVMNGFRTELINKIVGFNAHITVQTYDNEIKIEDVKNSVDLILDKFASIDIVINNAAIIDVNLVKKVPTDLADVKLSCETPKPKAPPSDLCNKIMITKIIAKAILTKISKLSIMFIYSNFLLYQ